MTGERVLVVDDSKDIRDIVIEHILKPYAFDYMIAENGEQAMEMIRERPPDLILTDMQMPRMDGLGLLRSLRDEQINIPVVLMTSHGSEELAIEVFRMGVRDYVRKPFSEEELLMALETALIETRLRREQDRLNEDLSMLNDNLLMHVEHLEILHQIGRDVLSIDDSQALIKKILTVTNETSNSKGVRLALRQDGQLIEVGKLSGGLVTMVEMVIADELADEVIDTNELRIGEPEADDSFEDFSIPMYIPVCVGETQGVMIVLHEADAISEPLLHLLSALVIYCAAALERVRLADLVK